MTYAKQRKRAQPAIEYLSTYGWALLIIVIAIALIFIFRNAQSSAVPESCSLSTAITCKDMILGSNSLGSLAVLVLTNAQQYPVGSPVLVIKAQSQGNVTGACSPSFILPGASMICSVSLPNSYGQGTVVASNLYVKETVCTKGSSQQSCTGPTQTISGSATSHVQPILSSTPFSVSLSAQNATQSANGQEDTLTAKVYLLGSPYQGAGISFTESQTFASINPSMENTNTNGIAVSYISSHTPGNVIVTSSFDGYSATNTIDFVPPTSVTFEITNTMNINGNVLTINGNTYTTSQLPLTLPVSPNTRYEYSYASSLTASNGLTLSGLVVSGCGTNSATGAVITDYNCTVVGTYTTVSGSSSTVPYMSVTYYTANIYEYNTDTIYGDAYTSENSATYVANTVVICASSNVNGATSDLACSGPNDYLVATGGANAGTAEYNTKELVSGSCTGSESGGWCYLPPGNYAFEACDLTYYNTHNSITDCSGTVTITVFSEPVPTLQIAYPGTSGQWACTSSSLPCTIVQNSGYVVTMESTGADDYSTLYYCSGIVACGGTGTNPQGFGENYIPWTQDVSTLAPGEYTLYEDDDAATSPYYYISISSLKVYAPSPATNAVVKGGTAYITDNGATGGTTPYHYQWIATTAGGSTFNSLNGNALCGASANTLTCAFATNSLTATGVYQFELQATDSESPAATDNSVVASVAVTGSATYSEKITLTNSQSSATAAPFQQQIVVNSLSLSSYINSAWSNVDFSTGNAATGTILGAWVESGASNTATNTLVWVSLPSSIGANSNTVIYMNFMGGNNVMSSAGPTGEAPQLSSTYAQNDNGGYVFPFYSDFSGTTLPTSMATGAYGYDYSYSVSNGLTITTTTAYGYYYTGAASTYSQPLVTEDYVSSYTGNVAPLIGESLTSGPSSNFATGYAFQLLDSEEYLYNEYSGATVSQGSGPGSYLGTYSFSWYQTGGQTGTFGGDTLTGLDSSNTIGNYYPFVGTELQPNGPGSFTITWLRARAYPPSGVMPSVTGQGVST